MPTFETPSERMEFFDYAVQERRTHAYGPDNAEHDTRDGAVVLRFFCFPEPGKRTHFPEKGRQGLTRCEKLAAREEKRTRKGRRGE